jgi:hypothetical protein
MTAKERETNPRPTTRLSKILSHSSSDPEMKPEPPEPAKREVVKETVKKTEPKEVQKVDKRGAKVIKLFFFLSFTKVSGNLS